MPVATVILDTITVNLGSISQTKAKLQTAVIATDFIGGPAQLVTLNLLVRALICLHRLP
jgi:hypothetical protein